MAKKRPTISHLKTFTFFCGLLAERLPSKAPPARKLWERSLAAKASATPAGRSRAFTLTPNMDRTMTNAASSAAHSLAVMMAPDTL